MLQHVHDQAFVLLALPQHTIQLGIPLARADALRLLDELLPRARRREVVLREQVGAVVENADVHVPRQPPHAAVPDGGGGRRREVRRQLAAGDPRREVEQPAGLRELRHPDEVEQQHVEGRRGAVQIDHVELVLLVAGPRERLAAHGDAGIPALELAQEAGDGIERAEDLGVLEDDRGGRGSARRLGAPGERDERGEDERRAPHQRSSRGSRSPKIAAPRRNASASVSAAPTARLPSHHSRACSSDRKKFKVCQRAVHALPRRSSRLPTQAITPAAPAGPWGLTSRRSGAAQ